MLLKTIIITRPKGDEEELAEMLHERGLRVIHEPLTHIFMHHTARAELEQAILANPDAVIITSRQGVHALAALTNLRDLMVICAGNATTETAQSLGFTRTCYAGNTASDLVAYIREAYDEQSRFIYASGQHIRLDISQELSAYGMQVKRVVVYEAAAATQLSDTLIEQLKRGQVDAISFMSVRTAEILHALLKTAAMEHATTTMHAFCLSPTIASVCERHDWRAIHIADKPTLASLIECVDNALSIEKNA